MAEPENRRQESNGISSSERMVAVDMAVILPTEPRHILIKDRGENLRVLMCFARDVKFCSEPSQGQHVGLDLYFDAWRLKKVIPRGNFC